MVHIHIPFCIVSDISILFSYFFLLLFFCALSRIYDIVHGNRFRNTQKLLYYTTRCKFKYAPQKQRLSHNHMQQSLFCFQSVCIPDQSLYKTLFFRVNAFNAFSMAVSQNFQSWTPSHSSYVRSTFLLLHSCANSRFMSSRKSCFPS